MLIFFWWPYWKINKHLGDFENFCCDFLNWGGIKLGGSISETALEKFMPQYVNTSSNKRQTQKRKQKSQKQKVTKKQRKNTKTRQQNKNVIRLRMGKIWWTWTCHLPGSSHPPQKGKLWSETLPKMPQMTQNIKKTGA